MTDHFPDSRLCKRLLQDEVLLDESASAFSVLLAVAERELGAASATPGSPQQSKASVIQHSSSQPQKKPYVEILPKPTNTNHFKQSENRNPEADDNNMSSNQENDCEMKSINKVITTTGSKNTTNQSLLCNRSALRSLLENNRNTPRKSEFPVIKKFVANEDKNENVPALVASSQVQTLVIRNFGVPSQLVRRPALSIPWQLNHQAVNAPQFVTRLNVGFSAPPTSPPHEN